MGNGEPDVNNKIKIIFDIFMWNDLANSIDHGIRHTDRDHRAK